MSADLIYERGAWKRRPTIERLCAFAGTSGGVFARAIGERARVFTECMRVLRLREIASPGRLLNGSAGRPNVLTLSCKNRLTRMAKKAALRLPRPTRSSRSELQPT